MSVNSNATYMGYNSNDTRLLQEWGKLLDRMNWSAFCTFTPPYRVTPQSARRKMINLHTVLSLKHGPETRMFWVAEPFADRNMYHMHALIKIRVVDALIERSIEGVWHSISRPKGIESGKLGLIEKYQPRLGASYYLAKHLNKDNVDYDLF
jgi:hypothetical protein